MSKGKHVGRSLWEVIISHRNPVSPGCIERTGLWISTTSNSMTRAAKAAEKFLERKENRQSYPGALVRSITNRGWLDA